MLGVGVRGDLLCELSFVKFDDLKNGDEMLTCWAFALKVLNNRGHLQTASGTYLHRGALHTYLS